MIIYDVNKMMAALTQGGNVIATINLIIISRRFKVNMMYAKANFYPYGVIANYSIIEPKGFPKETLFRYHTILTQEKTLEQFDQIFYCDADMQFVAPVGDIYSRGITGHYIRVIRRGIR